MVINEGTFIRINYSVKVGSQLIDTTDEAEAQEAKIFEKTVTYEPLTVCVGQKYVVLGFDEAFIGKDAGFEGDVSVPPEKAYGERDSKRVKSFPKNSFSQKPTKGMTVRIEKVGEGRVTDIIGSKVIVDFNAVLAGHTLDYHYKIEDVIEDPFEQLKGILKIYTGKNMDVAIVDGKATITLLPETFRDSLWLLWRSRIFHEAFTFIPSISDIELVEKIMRPEKTSE